VRGLDRGQGAVRELGPAGRQHARDQGVPCQGVPEPDLAGLADQQALPDALFERLRDGLGGLAGGGVQQLPVHAAAEQGGRDQHVGLPGVEQLHAGAHGLGERPRYPGRAEELLHQERHALGEAPDPGEVVARGVRGGGPHDRVHPPRRRAR
jgi:hypothetical protein